ncbi:MAG: hypothetical protein LIV29_04900 [Denitrobacterium sp.]|nr:hypothetical protein [Denitrobacterium sp.]
MSHKLAKTGVAACTLALAAALCGCASSAVHTPSDTAAAGPASSSATVQARTSDQIAQTAATLEKASDNDTMGEQGTQSVSLGQTVTGDGYTFKLDSYEYTDEIDQTSGGAALHLDEVGTKYLVLKGTFTNTSDSTENIRKGTAAWFTFDGVFTDDPDYGIQGWTDAFTSDGTNVSDYIVPAGQSVDFFIYAEVPDTVAEGATGAHVLWGVNSTLDDAHYEAADEGTAYDITAY